MADSFALLEEVRRAALGNETDALHARLSGELAGHPEPLARGAVHLARAILTQNSSDPRPAAADAHAAWEILRRTPEQGHAAYAAAASAGLLQRCGRLAEAVDLAVEAMLLLDQVEMEPEQAVRIANALAIVFGQLSSFDIAVDLSERAFLGAASLGPVIGEIVCFTMAYLTIDGSHSRDEPPRRWVELARSAAVWLREHADTPVGTALFTDGVSLELAMLTDDLATIEQISGADDGADFDIYPHAADRVLAWHRFVRGAALGRIDRPTQALALLDRAVPMLKLVDDQPRLVRALTSRVGVRSMLGDHDGALGDALDLGRLARRWQTDQVGRLAAQISRRAELEHAQEQLSRRAERLAEEAATDVVTGVSTRRELEHRLDELAASDLDGAVIVFDLDFFKHVNDRFGHHTGDIVLRRIGGLLRATVGPADVAARYGGEEFVVVLTDADAVTAQAYAERIRARLSGESWGSMAPGLRVTSSAGVATGPFSEIRVLLNQADHALYDAKRAGRDRVVLAGSTAVPVGVPV